MAKILLFDVNETLLDLDPLRPHFERIFGDPQAMSEWFLTLLHSSLTATLAGAYEDFARLAGSALDVVAEKRGVRLEENDRRRLLGTIKRLPPHREVPESLGRLRDAGCRLFTLTNSPPDTLRAQMENSGLKEYFEETFSVDAVRKFKPAPETYRWAADEIGAEIGELLLIAAHDWDIAGAANAGCRTAYVARPGKVYNPLYRPADLTGADLREVADRIIGEKE